MQRQGRISDAKDRSLQYVKNMIMGKAFNSRWQVERTLRDHAYRVDAEKLKKVSGVLYETLPKINAAAELDEF